MEELKELLRPSQTTWFNHTEHRVTHEPSAGVACLSCHVNGHTNAAIELAPDSRPNQARLRVDTPSMRGNYNLMQLSSKRSIRSMDHFAEVEFFNLVLELKLAKEEKEDLVAFLLYLLRFAEYFSSREKHCYCTPVGGFFRGPRVSVG